MKTNHPDIIGQKVMIESSGSATQKNGQPYTQKWVMIIYSFSNHIMFVLRVRLFLSCTSATHFSSSSLRKLGRLQRFENTIIPYSLKKSSRTISCTAKIVVNRSK